MSRTVALLLNPMSAGAKSARLWPVLGQALEAAGAQVEMLVGSSPERSSDLARRAVDGGADALVAVGGDGTVRIALQAVAGTGTPLGIIPLGTGNDNARMLGIDLDNPLAAVGVVNEWNLRTIDVGSAVAADGRQQFFLSVAAMGFDSRANERARAMTWPRGDLRYVRAMLAELRTLRAVDFEVVVDGTVLRDRGLCVAVGNGIYYGGGMRICQGARIDDGLLTMTWIHECSAASLLRAIPGLYTGRHLDHPAVTQHVGASFRIAAADQVACAEGEPLGELPVAVEVHPGALQVLAPPAK